MPTPEMLALRPVNQVIGNLTRHVVSQIDLCGTGLGLRFQDRESGIHDFGLRMDALLGFIDRGVVGRLLTAGIVWSPVGDLGRGLAARANVEPTGLIELRLDFEDATGLVTRFQAVAHSFSLIYSA